MRIVRVCLCDVNLVSPVLKGQFNVEYHAATIAIANTCPAMTFKRNNETSLTYALKLAAWEWLYSVARCDVIGFEVRLEGPGGRIVDVAGVTRDKALYVVEVKSSVSDFRRDDNDARDKSRLRSEEEALDRMTALTQEIVEEASNEIAAAQATLDLELLTQKASKRKDRESRMSTKFHDPGFLRVADYNYLMLPTSAVRRNKLPPYWGLLAPEPQPHVVKEAPRVGGSRPPHMYAAILRAIARSNTRDMMRAHGVEWTLDGIKFPAPDSQVEE